MKLPKRSVLLLSMDSVKQLLGDAVADSHTLDTTNGWCKYKEAVRKKIEEKEVWLSRAWKTANIVTFARYIYRYRNTFRRWHNRCSFCRQLLCCNFEDKFHCSISCLNSSDCKLCDSHKESQNVPNEWSTLKSKLQVRCSFLHSFWIDLFEMNKQISTHDVTLSYVDVIIDVRDNIFKVHEVETTCVAWQR